MAPPPNAAGAPKRQLLLVHALSILWPFWIHGTARGFSRDSASRDGFLSDEPTPTQSRREE